MSSVLYPKGKDHLLGKASQVDLDSDTIKVMLVASASAPYSSTNEYVSDLSSSGIVARSGALSATLTSGVFDAADITVPSVSGLTIDALVIYKDTGSDATSPLLAWLDVTPYGPNGGDISIIWSTSGIFAI